MTENQLKYLQLQEAVRHNVAMETQQQAELAEDMRANRAKEEETNRSNVAREAETNRSNIVDEIEQRRSNMARESNETRRTDELIKDNAWNRGLQTYDRVLDTFEFLEKAINNSRKAATDIIGAVIPLI